MQIAVLGAGIVGLSTAVNLQERFPSSSVTIIAEKFFSETTSYVAAGSFRYRSSPQETRRDLEDRLCRRSMEHYWRLASSELAADSGVTSMSMLELRENVEEAVPFYGRYVKLFRKLNHQELIDLGLSSSGCKSGYSCITTMTECKYYLPYLMRIFQSNGGNVIKRKLHSLQDVKELSPNYAAIINCTGLGSRILFADDQIYPVRGQVLVVRAPWIHNAINALENTYFYPCRDGVVVGGVRQKNDWETNARPTDSQDILNRAAAIIPSIKKAEILKEKVGLRPARPRVRIECEMLEYGQQQFLVVHNYGHGGHGIALSWGSAMEAVDLLEHWLSHNPLKSKL